MKLIVTYLIAVLSAVLVYGVQPKSVAQETSDSLVILNQQIRAIGTPQEKRCERLVGYVFELEENRKGLQGLDGDGYRKLMDKSIAKKIKGRENDTVFVKCAIVYALIANKVIWEIEYERQ